VMLKCTTRRRSCANTRNTYSTWKRIVGTVKKSTETNVLAWLFRKVRQVCEGGLRCRTMYLATLVSPMVMPNLSSSWDPSLPQFSHSRPVEITSLPATYQNMSPQPSYPPAEYAEAISVTRYRVIVEVALHDRFEPLTGFRHRFMHPLTKLLLDFCQLPPHALADRMAF